MKKFFLVGLGIVLLAIGLVIQNPKVILDIAFFSLAFSLFRLSKRLIRVNKSLNKRILLVCWWVILIVTVFFMALFAADIFFLKFAIYKYLTDDGNLVIGMPFIALAFVILQIALDESLKNTSNQPTPGNHQDHQA
ncbi:hypothetical protein [Neobacillus soli]|uniref:hypothetical protein n=1 Tax=Neobacillus soli TaxID=220688 RepID=UPI0008271094|nr:hypothetical protein [Neobacillus soli]